MPEKKTILVAEDNDFVRMQIVRYLAETDADVIEASDGEAAFNAVKKCVLDKKAVSLAIVDIRMEPMDGFEFIKGMKGLGVDVPVILVTGDNNPDLLEQAGALGVNAVMIKPVQKDRLVKTVLRILDAHKRGRE